MTKDYAFGVSSELVDARWQHWITRRNLATGHIDRLGHSVDDSGLQKLFDQAKLWEENQAVPGYFFPAENGPQSYAQYILELKI